MRSVLLNNINVGLTIFSGEHSIVVSHKYLNFAAISQIFESHKGYTYIKIKTKYKIGTSLC